MKIRLRYILTAAFAIVALVPLTILGFWIEHTALKNELDAVWEKHLLLADHTAALLNRYAKDAEATFDYFASLPDDAADGDSSLLVVRQLGMRHFCIFNNKSRVIRDIRAEPGAPSTINAEILTGLMPLVNNTITYSPVMPGPTGEPTIYMIKRLDKNRIALAALSTDYIVRLQRAITFGQRGHAAIVDQRGNVIAHPSDAWRKSMKNIAGLEPVKRMLAKERGTVMFYSPVMKSEMISGYTTVPQTGWGVMVPQPMGELMAKADDVKRIALIIAIIGVAVAALMSWLFAKRLTKPIEAVQTAAQRLADGKLNSRVPPLPRLTASDLTELADDFNKMAHRIQTDQKALATALSRAQSADQAKTRFLANMSHELRTPLNAVIGFAETMENQIFGPVGNARYLEYAGDIRHSGEHLLSIIDYILDLSKLEGDHITVENNVVDVAALAQSVKSMLQRTADDGQVALSVELPYPLPAVRGSEVKLKQILVNLVANAVKYTLAGGSVIVSARPDQGGGIAIIVRDTGIGMSKADLTTALLPFGRVENEMSERVNGSGIGLPLAKRLVEAHGGRLEIQSERGAGTTVIVHLPAGRVIAAVA